MAVPRRSGRGLYASQVPAQHNRVTFVPKLVFQPVVLENQGGCSKSAAAFLHRLAEAVATTEGTSAAVINSRLPEQLALAVARSNGRAVRRRRQITAVDAAFLSAHAALGLGP